MKVIAVAQQKGGVGKTMIAVHLACEAAQDGLAVVLLELDKQGTASMWSELRGGETPPQVTRVESNALTKALRALRDGGADLAIIDLPGAHSPAITPAIKAADLVLIPTRANEIDIAASTETLSACHRLDKRYGFVLTFTEPGAGKTREAKDAKETRQALEEAGHPVADADIARRQVFVDAVAAGRTAREIEAKGKGAAEIARLWAWVRTQLEIGNHG